MRHILCLVAIAALISGAGACSDDDEPALLEPTATEQQAPTATEPTAEVVDSGASDPMNDGGEAVFSFATDDLCEWVTEDEVAEFIAAEYDWQGTAVVDGWAGGLCGWVLTDDSTGEAGSLIVYEEGNRGRIGGGLGFPEPAEGEIVDFAEAGWPDIGGASVVGHPALSEGVAVYDGGFGQFWFWVPPRAEYLSLLVQVPGQSDGRAGWGPLAVGDRFIEELGWLVER